MVRVNKSTAGKEVKPFSLSLMTQLMTLHSQKIMIQSLHHKILFNLSNNALKVFSRPVYHYKFNGIGSSTYNIGNRGKM